MLSEELASLNDIVTATADESGANDADDLGEEIVMLLERARVGPVVLQLGIRGEEAGDVERAEEVGVENVLCAGAGLGEFEEEGKTGVLVVLLIGVTWRVHGVSECG